jgi:quercetin dioxygenase-like cupin family protein
VTDEKLPQALEEQAMLHALGILDPEDRQALSQKIQQSSDQLRQEVKAYQSTVDALASAVAPMMPPATLRDRFVQQMAVEAAREARTFELTANAVALGSVPLTPANSLRERLLSRIEAQADVQSYAPVPMKRTALMGDAQVLSEGTASPPGITAPSSGRLASSQGLTLIAWWKSCWESIWNRARRAAIQLLTSKAIQGSAKGLTFIKASEGVWLNLAPGVKAKVLSLDQISGRVTSLVRFAPGTSYAPHRHAAAEELFVLEGGCLCAGRELKVGDYHRAEAGTEHHDTSTDDGCLLLVISSPQNEMIR